MSGRKFWCVRVQSTYMARLVDIEGYQEPIEPTKVPT